MKETLFKSSKVSDIRERRPMKFEKCFWEKQASRDETYEIVCALFVKKKRIFDIRFIYIRKPEFSNNLVSSSAKYLKLVS